MGDSAPATHVTAEMLDLPQVTATWGMCHKLDF